MQAKFFSELASKVAAIVPSELEDKKQRCEAEIKSILQLYFANLDLVTREEFDVQKNVLLKTRKKLEALESKLAEK